VLVTLNEIQEAQARIRGVAAHTPLVRLTSPEFVGEVFIKAEGLQHTTELAIQVALIERQPLTGVCPPERRQVVNLPLMGVVGVGDWNSHFRVNRD